MNSKAENATLLETLFERAAELPATERAAFLDRACEDQGLRRQLDEMLRSHDEAGSFLDTSDRTSLWPLSRQCAGPSLVGRSVKQYRVTRRIGVGGMGVVYEAEQTNPRRRVALKVLRQGLVSRSAGRRIAIEAEALGRLNHHGVAQIIEAGVADLGDGPQPFFAMELVEGDTLLEYVKKRNPSTRRRLALFVRICEAVHHAHQKGVIHRDLKPANILVVERSCDEAGDDELHPKILDFGVARATDSDIQYTTMQSDSGAIIGTVAYMSPEQIRGELTSVDARSDVYALGVILFELLTRRLPFDVRSKPIPEAMRMISEDEPTLLGALDRSLRGDLETITRTAMARDPARRYVSAAAFADDVRRHLNHEPVAARAPGALYRLDRFVRRHRVLAASILIIAALLVGALVTNNAERIEAVRARQEAERQYDEAMRMSNFFLTDVVTRLERAPGTLEIRRDLLEEILRQTHSQLASRPDSHQLLSSHARALESMANLLSYDEARNEEAHDLARKAVDIRLRIIELNPDDHWQRMKYAVSLVRLAQFGAATGRLDDPIPHFTEALQIDEELAHRHPEERRYLDNLFWSQLRIGQHWIRDDHHLTEQWFKTALETAETLRERFPDHYLTSYAYSQANYSLSQLARYRQDYDLALERIELARPHAMRLLELYPNSRQFMLHGARVHQLEADLARRRGDRSRAESSLLAAFEILEQLAPYEQDTSSIRFTRSSVANALQSFDTWMNAYPAAAHAPDPPGSDDSEP